VERLESVIQESIFDDLSSCQASNAFQASMQSLGMSDQWSIYANRAAQKLVLDKVNLVELESENFDEDVLTKLQSWLEFSLKKTLHHWQLQHLDDIHSRLDHDICIQLGHIRSRQLFDIIKDFPLSTPALADLNTCKDQCNLQPYISEQLSQALEARLLHPGASTRDIIQFYTHLIRALRYIDPSGVILSHVIGPVRTYLRARSDTIPVIVASLLGQAGDFTLLRDMMRESGDAHGLGGADTSLAVYEEEDDGNGQSLATLNMPTNEESTRMIVIPSADEEDWTPRPIDAGPDYRQSRKSDVIAIIVSIFDDEEGFVSALENSCAEQLIQVPGYDTSSVYETNENLKKRFGDTSLSRCDVMLNDIKKSQRYDRGIQAGGDQEQAFRALHPFILSRQFWPPMKEAAPLPTLSTSSMFGEAPTMSSLPASFSHAGGKTVKMPGQFARALEQYQAAFKKMAPTQRLRWFNARSTVLLEVEMNDGRRIKERVTPLQAAIIEVAAEMNASREEPMKLSTLVTELECDKETILEGGVFFWTGRNVLQSVDSEMTLFAIVEDITQESVKMSSKAASNIAASTGNRPV
jgi:anaphase-promoting complex subunit 2